jgi:anti-sigma regulatory factor (Ser/Thr protein kinase)
MIPYQVFIPVHEASQVGEARRQAVRIAERVGLNESDRGKVAIVATELGNNLVRHAGAAGHGEIALRLLAHAEGNGVEILAIDKGPGMADVGRCLQDGYSTGGTAGQGLGAVKRLATEFDVTSAVGAGTVVLARLLDSSTPPPAPAGTSLRWGVVNKPVKGETECGDTWRVVRRHDGAAAVLVADGLGHGPAAAEAANAAALAFDADPFADLKRVFEKAHAAARGTRGAAVAAAHIDPARRALRYAGIGNIAGTVVEGGVRRGLSSHNGTVGAQMHKVHEFEYPWPERGLLVMHSDGLATRWDPSAYPGLTQRHPAVVAGVLYRDFTRGRDDVTVLVVS